MLVFPGTATATATLSGMPVLSKIICDQIKKRLASTHTQDQIYNFTRNGLLAQCTYISLDQKFKM